MAELFIAADDFTGALDTGVKLARQGIPARVVTGPEGIQACAETVLEANLDSRHLESEAAYLRTKMSCGEALRLGVKTLYIKTDSGLRGNIGAALEAAAQAVNGKVVFAPAYPDLNRRTVNGIHMIGDVPVTQSVFGKDLLDPVKNDRTAEIIAEQSTLPIYIQADSVHDGSCIELLELNTNEDMLSYAKAHTASNARANAGCAGFAAVLGTLLKLKSSVLEEAALCLPLAVFSASMSAVNLEQMRRGEAAGLRSCRFLDVLEAGPDLAALVQRAFKGITGVLIETALNREEVEALSREGENRGLDTAARGKRIATNMGSAAKALLDAGFDGTLCFFGGDTLSAALQAMKCRGLKPLAEIEPGVVLSEAALFDREITIVSKSGSFGSPDVISNLIHYAEGHTDEDA